MAGRIVGGIGVSLIGALMCWLAAHSIRDDVNYRKMPGLRTPETLESWAAWLAAHRRISPVMWRTGLAALLLGAVGVIWGVIDGRGSAEVAMIICLAVFIPVVIYVYRAGTKAVTAES